MLLGSSSLPGSGAVLLRVTRIEPECAIVERENARDEVLRDK
jgi:hypothetical protein